MAANTSPIFTNKPDIQFNTANITAANTTRDLTGGTSYLIYDEATANPAGGNGAYIQKVVVRPLGTNVVTVMRLWFNNGGALSTAANNVLLDEQTMVATTSSETAMLTPQVFNLFYAIPAGGRLYVTIGSAVAAGFGVSVIAGKF